MPSTLPLLLPTPPTALLPTAKLLMKDCPVLVKYLIIYLFDAASVVPVNQLLVCSMHINIGQLLICSMHIIVEIDWHILVTDEFCFW